MKKHSPTKIGSVPKKCAIILFLAAIFSPLVWDIVNIKEAVVVNEKRSLAAFPKIAPGVSALKKFPGEFEKYYNDRFPLRGILIALNGYLKTRVLSTSPIPKVVIGKQGWLFYRGDNVSALKDDYLLNTPFDPIQLLQLQLYLEAKHDWLADQGIPYLLVVVPDKQSVYPEFLPDGYVPKGCRLDQLRRHLQAGSYIQMVDVGDALIKAKKDCPVYYKNDTHWNEYGAFIAYGEIIRKLAAYFPGMRPLPPGDFKIEHKVRRGFDLSDMLATSYFFEETVPLLSRLSPLQARKVEPDYRLHHSKQFPDWTLPVFEERAGHLPKMVLFGDSFRDALVPYLSEHFSRSGYAYILEDDLYQPIIAREHPDVVIDEIVERSLRILPTLPINHEFQNIYFRKCFYSSSTVLNLANSQTNYAGINPLNQAIISKDSPHKKGLRIHATGNDPFVELPAFTLPEGSHPIIKIDIMSPADTTLQVFYVTTAYREYSESKSIRRPLKRGRNLLYVPVPASDLYGKLRLDPGEVPGNYFVNSIEVSMVPKQLKIE